MGAAATSKSSSRSQAFKERTMQDMLHSLDCGDDALRAYDGWRYGLLSGTGFRHDYDAEVARGGWEFYALMQGLCVVVADIVATCKVMRVHRLQEQLVLSAALEGDILIDDAWGNASGKMMHGYCTYYGMQGDAQLQTIYEPNRPLKWVSIFIDRRKFFDVTGLAADDLHGPIREFVVLGGNLAPRHVPLSRAASLAAMRIKDCPYQGRFRRTFMRAKALELACELLFASAHLDEVDIESIAFTAADHDKLSHAMQMISGNLDQPLAIKTIATAVGLTRRKLQLGFRLIHGDTVARVRDKLRMEHALELVRESGHPMIDIALKTGYEHQASFTRAFKAAYGVCPIQMRRMACDTRMIEEVASHRL